MTSTQSDGLLEEENTLGHKFAQFVEFTECEQIATDIHQFTAWAHEHLKTPDVDLLSLGTLGPPKRSWVEVDWRKIIKNITIKEGHLRLYHWAVRDRSVPPKMPDVPYFYEVGRASGILQMQYGHVRDLAKAYAHQTPKQSRGINQFVEDCDWEGLAKSLNQTLKHLKWYFRHYPLGEAYMRDLFKRIREHFFLHCDMVNWDETNFQKTGFDAKHPGYLEADDESVWDWFTE
ncbi:MAG: hypothetical protein L6R40_008650, partial [Gallowayella cf. fulva]